MKHLTEDELFELALKVSAKEELGDLDQIELKHIQECRECYEKFCVALALCDATSDDGIAMTIKSEKVEQERQMECLRVMSVIQVMRYQMEEARSAVMEQMYRESAAISFEPAMSFAIRGNEAPALHHLIRMEELEDEKTYVAFDAQKSELYVQLNRRCLPEDQIHIYLMFEKARVVEVPAVIEGKFVKGHMTEVPQENFQIYITSESNLS